MATGMGARVGLARRNEGPWGARRRRREPGPLLRAFRPSEVEGDGDGDGEDWHFTDFTPPPIRGQVAGIPISLRVWPPDVIPTYGGAFRVRSGALAGFWVAVEFP